MFGLGAESLINPQIQHFYDAPTGTLSYVVADKQGGRAAIIDCVLGFSMVSGRMDSKPSDVLLEYVREHDLSVDWILETHAHADHLSGAQFVKQRYPDAEVAIGEGITGSQETFKRVFGLPEEFPTDGSQFDRLLRDGETVQVGTLSFEVIATPGHTPGCSSYRFDNHLFT